MSRVVGAGCAPFSGTRGGFKIARSTPYTEFDMGIHKVHLIVARPPRRTTFYQLTDSDWQALYCGLIVVACLWAVVNWTPLGSWCSSSPRCPGVFQFLSIALSS